MRGQISYKKDLQKTYLIVKECREELIESYAGKMVMRGAVKGLLKCRKCCVDGEWEIWYDITSMQELEQVFAVKEMDFAELKDILLQVIYVLGELEKCLVPDSQLCFSETFIFMDLEKKQLSFLYDYHTKQEKTSLLKLAEYLLEKIDHEDERSVALAYFFYEQVQKDSFSVKELEQFWQNEDFGKKPDAEQTVSQRLTTEQTVNQRLDAEHTVNRWLATEQAETQRFDTEMQRIGADYAENERLDAGEALKKDGRVICWEDKGGRLLEGGLVCICMAVCSLAGYWVVQRFLEFRTIEKGLWIGLSCAGIMCGVFLSVIGRKKQKEKVSLPGIPKETEENLETEEALYRHMIEEPLQDCDGKTVYVGNALLNRNYSLVESVRGEERRHALSVYPFLIGKERERVHLRVSDNSVSRIHAKITEENGSIYLEDLHSTNGTYLNDMRLEPHERKQLKKGDIVQFGKKEFLLY